MATTQLSAQEAINLLTQNPEQYSTKEALQALADRVSVYSPGSTTVLYGGSSGFDGISTNDLVNTMNGQGLDTRNINRTELFKFLDSTTYKSAVASAFEVDIDAVQTRGTAANDFLYNAQSGEWARGSDRFALDTKGDVRMLASFAAQDRTLNLVEIGRAMGDPDVTKINGIDKAIFQKVYDQALVTSGGNVEAAQTALLESAKFSSSELLKDFRVAGTGDALSVGTGKFMQGTGVEELSLPDSALALSQRYGDRYTSVGNAMTPAEFSEWGRGGNNLAVGRVPC